MGGRDAPPIKLEDCTAPQSQSQRFIRGQFLFMLVVVFSCVSLKMVNEGFSFKRLIRPDDSHFLLLLFGAI